jgi:hypothetical protein
MPTDPTGQRVSETAKGTFSKMRIDAVPRESGCMQFTPTRGPIGSDKCRCGHSLYEHYMCGDPRESRCLICPTEPAEPVAVPQAPPEPTLKETLTRHWLQGIQCDHDAATDEALCYCGWRSVPCPNVGLAVAAWADHVQVAALEGKRA